jgi:1,4-alpha-glucan branching enzyme
MLSPDEIAALLTATHPDPFAVLGPHAEGDWVWIRTLRPGAIGVEVLRPDNDGFEAAVIGELSKLDEAGLFEGWVTPFELGDAYRLRVHYPLGHVEDIDDPYRFASSIGELDRHLLGEGSHLRPWQVLGSRPWVQEGVAGVRFCVWAPDASRVSVIGAFNEWDGRRHPMRLHPGLGVWELFVPGIGVGSIYKYEVRSREGVVLPGKADPFAFATELRPASASVVAPVPVPKPLREYGQLNLRTAPLSIYEVHLGSWRRPDHRAPPSTDTLAGDPAFLDWDALAQLLPPYVAELGFTHIELLPCIEHPFDGSWGYQVTGMYAPTRRFGDPAGFARLIAACHEHGLGVLLDWVPAHFPNDPHGLALFDGSAAYEYPDPREGLHRDWNTLIYNFGRNEVRNFLIGSALYWLECWDLDGLRVDAVASMLYRDYSRKEGEWITNVHGGRENLEAVALLQRVNEVVAAERPGAIVIAEESTIWPGVSRPISAGGLGFSYKWNMGWMHDTLAYMAELPEHRKHHHQRLTFGSTYAYSENFVLPLSHDEVVHGKGSLLNKMAGDRWQKFANLRAYYGFMWTQPGKKLLFMGGEFAQQREWDHDGELEWQLLDSNHEDHASHRGMQSLVRDLNALYRGVVALHELDCDKAGFEWITADDSEHSVLAYLRMDREGAQILVVCNFTPTPRDGYRVGLAEAGRWRLRLNTDATRYGGSGYADLEQGDMRGMGGMGDEIESDEIASDGRPHSLALILPPLATMILEPVESQ